MKSSRLVVWLFAAARAASENPLEPTGLISSPTNVGHAVQSLEKALRFYHNLLGLQVMSQDEEPVTDTAYGQLTNTVGSTYRTAHIGIPNQSWTIKLTEYTGLPRIHIKQPEQDPGSPALTLSVKSSSAVNAALKSANITTLNGQPLPAGGVAGTTSTAWVYDPDGYIVELVQRSGPSDYFTVAAPNVTNGPGMQYVIRGQLDLTMANVTQALTFYRDILGQNISAGYVPLIGPGEYKPVGFIGSIFNISSNVTWAAVTGNCNPDTRCEYFEYDDPGRAVINYPVQYPGIGMTTYTVKDLNSIIAKFVASNITVVTVGGAPVTIDGHRSIVVRDPSGYLVRLDE